MDKTGELSVPSNSVKWPATSINWPDTPVNTSDTPVNYLKGSSSSKINMKLGKTLANPFRKATKLGMTRVKLDLVFGSFGEPEVEVCRLCRPLSACGICTKENDELATAVKSLSLDDLNSSTNGYFRFIRRPQIKRIKKVRKTLIMPTIVEEPEAKNDSTSNF